MNKLKLFSFYMQKDPQAGIFLIDYKKYVFIESGIICSNIWRPASGTG